MRRRTASRGYYSARSQASAEYWLHFGASSDGVHAFGYNSAESEPIWMKSGALKLRVHSRQLALEDFGRDMRSSESWTAGRNFVFICQESNARSLLLGE